MKVSHILPICFSPTGQTKNIVLNLSRQLSSTLGVALFPCLDFTLPSQRQKYQLLSVSPSTLVVFGSPTYAGRIPNRILPFIETLFRGSNTPSISVVTFGNRSFDSSLTELSVLLDCLHFHVFAASAWVYPHVFSAHIASNRPNNEDIKLREQFVWAICQKLHHAKDYRELSKPQIYEKEIMPYYTPLDINGKPALFLKAKPITNPLKCNHCSICINHCPMGAISADNPQIVNGICIKCHACISVCPNQAKYFKDESFLSHVSMLEQYYTTPAKSEIYL